MGSETQSLTLKEQHKLKVFEKKVLKKISDPKKEEVSEQSRLFLTKRSCNL
jgi:hypothetical protein